MNAEVSVAAPPDVPLAGPGRFAAGRRTRGPDQEIRDSRWRSLLARGTLARFIVTRLLLFVPTAIGAGLFTFLLIKIIPGGPAYARLGEEATPEAVAKVEAALGLDRPLHVQFLSWLGNALTGDFGNSFQTGQPVAETIWTTLPVTVELALVAIICTALVAIPIGVYTGKRAHKRVGRWMRSASGVGLAVPDFFAALILIAVFSVWLGWLPRMGFVPFGESPSGNLHHMLLPALPMIMGGSAIVIRQVGAAMADSMQSDYVRTARAMGLSERVITWRYAFRAIIPTILNVIGLLSLGLIGATLILEQIFVLPGLGRTLLNAIGLLDFPLILGIVLVYVVIALIVNLIVDILSGIVDPAVRRSAT